MIFMSSLVGLHALIFTVFDADTYAFQIRFFVSMPLETAKGLAITVSPTDAPLTVTVARSSQFLSFISDVATLDAVTDI